MIVRRPRASRGEGRLHPKRPPSPRPGAPAAFAVDLDRTLKWPGRPPGRSASVALEAARALGLRVILVSGRTHVALRPLGAAFGAIDGIVAENGAVVEVPWGRAPAVVGGRIAAEVRLRLRAAPGLHVEYGRVVASVRIEDRRSVAALVEGLPVSLVENVDRVMVLPRGITKATGIGVALTRLRLGGREYAAIGDGENDVPMLRGAAVSGSVLNATPAARSAARYHCTAPGARGVLEFVRGPLTAWAHLAPEPPTPTAPRPERSGA